jgi:hypothetical protein
MRRIGTGTLEEKDIVLSPVWLLPRILCRTFEGMIGRKFGFSTHLTAQSREYVILVSKSLFLKFFE